MAKVNQKAAIDSLLGQAAKDKKNNKDLKVKIGDVVATIEAMGYDPVKKLVEARNGNNLNEFQKVAIDKEIMRYVHAQKKAVDINANVNAKIEFTISEDEDDL
jgi:hypothetical protein